MKVIAILYKSCHFMQSVIPEGFCTAVSMDTAIIWALFRPPKLKTITIYV